MSKDLELFIRRRANQKRLSITEVTRRAGISRQSLYLFWERRSYPNLRTVLDLANALQLPALRLLELYLDGLGTAAGSPSPPAQEAIARSAPAAQAHGDAAGAEEQDARTPGGGAGEPQGEAGPAAGPDAGPRPGEPDPLMDLPSGTSLEQLLRCTLEQAERRQAGVTVLVAEAEGLQPMRKRLGHAIADRAIARIVERIGTHLRSSDQLGRLDHDTVAVVLPGIASRESAVHIATRIQQAVEHPIELAGCSFQLQTTVGLAIYPTQGADASTLLHQARAALRFGPGGCHTADPSVSAEVADQLSLIQDLHEALQQDQLAIYYQPVSALADGTVTAVEALVRWYHPNRGWVVPRPLLAAAEPGMLGALDRWAAERLFRDASAWRQGGCRLPRLVLNASPYGPRRGEEPAIWARRIEEAGLPRSCLELELSERELLDAGKDARPALQQGRDAGLSMAVDHFGTGYASLISLRDLPADRLKLDQHLVRNLPHDTDQQALVGAIAQLGQRFGTALSAEGVETAEEAAYLRRHGFTEAQGHYLADPQPPGAIPHYLQANSSA